MRHQYHPLGFEGSRIAQGFWRLEEWNMTASETLGFIEACLDLGVTTFDHADIYGGYQCEALFGEALKLKPALRDKMEIITKCGILLPSENR
ncbi:MAG: aldo/keto reductase, partial [Gammaproteobacteria bacterium]|nr:aldo/keto reductase [Gammaproteobacteria bacterium]